MLLQRFVYCIIVGVVLVRGRVKYFAAINHSEIPYENVSSYAMLSF